MVSISKIESGIARWLDHEIMPTLSFEGQPGAMKRGAVTAASVYAVKRVTTAIAGIATNPMMLQIGAADKYGNIDLDGFAEEFKKTIPEAGYKLTIPFVAEITLVKSDFDTLLRYIKE